MSRRGEDGDHVGDGQQPGDGEDAVASEDVSEPTCPFCGSREVEALSPFASQLSTSQYLCRSCHSPFEYFTRGA